MDSITESGTLEYGVEIDGVVHREFTLRPAMLADSYQAALQVPVPDKLDDATHRVAYQMAIDDAMVLTQLTQLGTLPCVPPPAELAKLLDPDDMVQLRVAAEAVKKKRRGLSNTPSPSDSSN